MANKVGLLGTWQMVSWTREVVSTGEKSDAMGPNPIGYIAYHADGRMMALVVRRNRTAIKGKPPTEEEKAYLFDTMLAYSARYTLHDDRVIHHVDVAWNPAWVGTDQIRPYTLDGNRLVISGAPSKDPATGDDVIYSMEFTKVENPSSDQGEAA
jgi:Lipocalin-like domain